MDNATASALDDVLDVVLELSERIRKADERRRADLREIRADLREIRADMSAMEKRLGQHISEAQHGNASLHY